MTVEYECKKCGKKYNNKTNYTKHVEKKFPCQINSQTVNNKYAVDENKQLINIPNNDIINNEELTGKLEEIEDEKLEYELDLQCEKYNKYSTNNPAEYISYNNTKKRYILTLPKEKEKSSIKLENLINILKENKFREFRKKFSELSEFKKIQYKNKKIIIYLTEDKKAYFDINHVVNLFDELSAKDKKYQEYKNEISLYKIVDNEFGGFYIKEFISKEIFFKMILHTNSIFSNEFKNEVSKILDKLTDDNIVVIEDNKLMINENIITKNNNILKKKTSNNIMGINALDIYEVLNMNKHIVSCIYFFTLGTVKNLRYSMNIENKYDDDDIVGKFGFTKNLARRTYEHMQDLGEIENCELKLKIYSSIDPVYMSKAETEIKNCIDSLKGKIIYEDKEEIFVIKKNILTYVEEQYNMIGIKYNLHVSEFTNKLKEIEDIKDKEILINNIESLKKDFEMQNKNHDNIILIKDLQIQLQKEKYENIIKDLQMQLEKEKYENIIKNLQMQLHK
jgi:hypothetical protein